MPQLERPVLALSRFERALAVLSPRMALSRVRSRMATEMFLRHFEAAQPGRRTEGWRRSSSDANTANARALAPTRDHARDLVRNNPWARRGKQVVANNTVGWGIIPKPVDAGVNACKRARTLWRKWAGTTQCDFNGQMTLYGLQRLVVGTAAESGECLVRRYRRPLSDGLAIPLQIQVLEPDYIDTTRDNLRTESGGRIIQGIEYDQSGRRVAYWLFPEHPGSSMFRGGSQIIGISKRVPADDIRHIYDIDRPGAARAASWFASVIARLKDYDEYEDATLLRQKIAACFTAFVTDTEGTGNVGLGVTEPQTQSGNPNDNADIQTIEPGSIHLLPVGKEVTFGTPPAVVDGKFDQRMLRAIAMGLGITYEDLTGDYTGFNFSSARMSRLAHYANVHNWRWNMLIPMFCDPVWDWAMETAFIAGLIPETPGASWTPPPMPMIEPDKEGLAYSRLVRNGSMTFDEMIRELGGDPELHWQEYAEQLAVLDKLGITLDSDPRRTTQAGQIQQTPKAGKQSENSGTSGN